MQINSLKDNKILEVGLKDTGKEIKEQEAANEKVSLGEAFNKNIQLISLKKKTGQYQNLRKRLKRL